MVFLRYIYTQAEFACQALVVDHVAGFRFYCFWDGVLPKKKTQTRHKHIQNVPLCNTLHIHHNLQYPSAAAFTAHPSTQSNYTHIYIYITRIHGIHRSVRGIHVSVHPSPRSKNFMNFRPKKRLKGAYTSKEPLTGTQVSLGLVNELDECKSSGGSIWQSFDVNALYLQRWAPQHTKSNTRTLNFFKFVQRI